MVVFLTFFTKHRFCLASFLVCPSPSRLPRGIETRESRSKRAILLLLVAVVLAEAGACSSTRTFWAPVDD